jgi:hypothetical protein
MTPRTDVPVLLRRLKGTSARECNLLLGRTGQPFWPDESHESREAGAGWKPAAG